MPQMAPLNWLSLFIFFTLIFLMFNTINFFSIIYPIKKDYFKKVKSPLTWKW
uniref:ATP synthase complex subunit 8 n=1 Tax=Toxeutes macleayi TaxID=2546607 RepID=A0A7G8JRR5_9CUCU|nr:ATP synthase F0 subunit 8 [Toxeutes macleayi]